MTDAAPTVYIESNFLLELVLEQEELAACEEVLTLARAQHCRLVIPLYALIEPWEALRRRQSEMRTFSDDFERKLRELERMARAGIPAGTHKTLGRQFRDALNDWRQRLEDRRREVTSVARVLPLDLPTLDDAQELMRNGVIEREPDAVMLASVLRDLAQGAPESFFVNRNSRDFGPDVKRLLRPRGCSLLSTFGDGLGRLRAEIARRTPPSSSG